MGKEARELLLDFARSEWEEAHKDAPSSLESFINLKAASTTPTPNTLLGNSALQLKSGASPDEHKTMETATGVTWPENLTLKAVCDCVERRTGDSNEESLDSEADR